MAAERSIRSAAAQARWKKSKGRCLHRPAIKLKGCEKMLELEAIKYELDDELKNLQELGESL